MKLNNTFLSKKILTILSVLATLFIVSCGGGSKSSEGKLDGPIVAEGTPSKEVSSLPGKIKIINKGGISVRESNEKGAAITTTAHNGYTYEVTGGLAAYHQIDFLDQGAVWVSANPAEEWTEVMDGEVKIILKGGISVRKEPYGKGDSVGVAATGYKFKLLDTIYSYLKIKLPDESEGWIYIGKPDEPWVEVVD